ncbi:MAG: glycoside hydrolase family 3 C-terminal domain-containing protein [Muribaculaceae bacterium]|nr:glycoside hydrolase family 3 C-terminal domain-containing protein [Muribaculaceae bacterium]
MNTRKLLLAVVAAMMVLPAMGKALPVYLDERQPLEVRINDLLPRLTLDEKIALIHAQSKFSSPGVARLGIPTFWTDDGPHGVRPDVLWDEWEQAGATNDSCVAFPALTCLAATWNPAMARRYGVALGEEARYRGKDMILGPGVNIYRTPLNGRNFEYMGEDPFLAAQMVAPYVQGLQSQTVAACVKHFALNNNELFRHNTNVIVDDRALHEIYLPAFKAAVQQGGAWAIMGAYNRYKDIHNCHNPYLLNDILKGQWGFDGVVVSDWGGTHNLEQAITCGLDMEFGTWTNGLSEGARNAYDNYYLALPYKRLIEQGTYTTRELDEKVRRVLRLMLRTTLRDHRPRGSMCSTEHYATAREVATEGIVLLQNRDNALPITPANVKRVLVVGENAIKMMTVGGGSSSLKVQREVLPLDGLRNRLLRDGIDVDYARGYVGDTTGAYNGVTTGQNLVDHRSPQQLVDEAVEKARQADVVVFFGGLNKSNHQDAEEFDRESYALPYNQDAVIEALARVSGRLVVVNISGNAVAMPWRSRVQAIVQGWFIGSEAGNALADVLCGDVNPSGKLPFTWPERLEDVGAHALGDYPGTKRESEDVWDETYRESFYVGYRWVDKAKTQPTFAFGHGLSYTTFMLGKPVASATTLTATDSITFTIPVTNTGTRTGSEVVQLYVRDVKSSLPRPAKELKGFCKIMVPPGQTRQARITIGSDALSYYNPEQQRWVLEPGDFEALIGTASNNLPARIRFKLQ